MAGSAQGQPLFGLERGPEASARSTGAFLTPSAGPTPGKPGGRDPPQGVSSAQAVLGGHSKSGCLLVGSCWFCILLRGGCSPARSRFSALPVETSAAPCGPSIDHHGGRVDACTSCGAASYASLTRGPPPEPDSCLYGGTGGWYTRVDLVKDIRACQRRIRKRVR
jgi:hypothetical protein